MASAHITYSLTEVPQFHRLVQFVDDVATLVGEDHDTALGDLLDELRNDLLEMSALDG